MRYHEFIGLFEQPDMYDQTDLLHLPATIDLDDVQAFNDDGQHHTTVTLRSGEVFLLNVPYAQFKKILFHTPNPVNN